LTSGFVGRAAELGLLSKRLSRVAAGGTGLAVAIRGRRQVGKSRLVQEFCDQARAPYLFYTATRGASATEAVGAFINELRDSGLPRDALAIYRELDADAPTADALSELGGTYLCLGQVTDAITYLRQSLHIQRELGDSHHMAETLHRLGKAQAQAGEPSEARKHFAEALQLYEALGEIANAADVRSALTNAEWSGAALNPTPK
jgi:tetratricopeptide (TPR) repeat protein